jgi:hypothetical protein
MIAYRTSQPGINTSSSSFALTIPALAQVGDRAVVWMELDSAKVVTTPAGWRSLAAIDAVASTNPSLYIWEKELVSGEPGASTGNFSWTGADFNCPNMDVWSGVMPGANSMAVAPSTRTGTGAAVTVSGITPPIEDTMCAFVVVNWLDATTTSNGGFEESDTGHGACYDFAKPLAGPTGNKAATLSGATQWSTVMFAMTPNEVSGKNYDVSLFPKSNMRTGGRV